MFTINSKDISLWQEDNALSSEQACSIFEVDHETYQRWLSDEEKIPPSIMVKMNSYNMPW